MSDHGHEFREPVTRDHLAGRIAELEHERGGIARELGQIDARLTNIESDLSRILDRLEDRPSAAEMAKLERDVESVRAKARVPSASELRFEGPAWLGKVSLSGFSGVTIFAVIVTGIAGIVAWLVLK